MHCIGKGKTLTAAPGCSQEELRLVGWWGSEV